MNSITTSRFDRSFVKLTPAIQQKFRKQIILLLTDLRHPSLHCKKFDETHGIWQARVDRDVRFYCSLRKTTAVRQWLKPAPSLSEDSAEG